MKGVLSGFLEVPRGLFDPVLWRRIRWRIAMIVMIRGKIKWKEKNRFRVALLMEKPPQIQLVRICPM